MVILAPFCHLGYFLIILPPHLQLGSRRWKYWNALTCAARLGLTPRIISKVADDSHGKGILEELEADGVDSSFMVVSDGGNSPFTYIIVDNQTKTLTCIHTPGYPPMIPSDLFQSNLVSALDGAKLVYFDVRLHEIAAIVAEECRQIEG